MYCTSLSSQIPQLNALNLLSFRFFPSLPLFPFLFPFLSLSHIKRRRKKRMKSFTLKVIPNIINLLTFPARPFFFSFFWFKEKISDENTTKTRHGGKRSLQDLRREGEGEREGARGREVHWFLSSSSSFWSLFI